MSFPHRAQIKLQENYKKKAAVGIKAEDANVSDSAGLTIVAVVNADTCIFEKSDSQVFGNCGLIKLLFIYLEFFFAVNIGVYADSTLTSTDLHSLYTCSVYHKGNWCRGL